MVVCELFSYEPLCDIPNWLTVIIELTIGGIIATIFFLKQAKQGKKLQRVIDENKKANQQRKTYSTERIALLLQVIYLNSDQITRFFQIPKNNWAPQQEYMYRESSSLVEKDVNELELTVTRYSDVLDTKLISEINGLLDFLKDRDAIKQDTHYKNIKKIIVGILNKIGKNKYGWKE